MLGRYSGTDTDHENVGRSEIRGYSFVACGTLIHLDGAFVVDSFGPRNLVK
jgi:hypothetical protein